MTVNTNHVAAPQPIDAYLTLWERWIALWNGDLPLARAIISDQFVLHIAGESKAPEGRAALVDRIAAMHAAPTAARVTVEAGPLISSGLVVGRWSVTCGLGDEDRGDDRRGETLAPVRGTGTDILRIDSGRVIECWTSRDLAAMTISRLATTATRAIAI